MTSTDPDYGQAIQEFKKGGWVVSLLGFAGMTARLLITDEDSTIARMVKKSIAGGIVGVIGFFALWPADIPGIYKAVIMATSGTFAPEWMQFIKERITNAKQKKKSRKRR